MHGTVDSTFETPLFTTIDSTMDSYAVLEDSIWFVISKLQSQLFCSVICYFNRPRKRILHYIDLT